MNFSITRMLLAVASVSMAFSAFSYLGFEGIVVSSVIGLCVGVLCLVVKRNQIWPMVRTVCFTVAGCFAGVLCALVTSTGLLMSDPIPLIEAGGLLGFLAGVSKTAFDSDEKKLHSKSAENEVS